MQLVNKARHKDTQAAPNATFPFNPSQDKSIRLSKVGREAEESLKKAIALNPRNDQAYVELGKLSVDLIKSSQAEESLNKAIALNPHNDRAYFELGRNYIYGARIKEAEESLKKAIALNPRNDRAYADLGWCYIIQGMFLDAERALRKSLALNCCNDQTLFELGRLCVGLGRFTEGEKYLKMSLETNHFKQETYGSLAVAYQSMGRGGLADEYYRKADEISTRNPNKKTYRNYLAMKKTLDQKNVRLVCVQYPMRSIEPLKKIFLGCDNVIFVDNERSFKETVKEEGYKEYFVDMFGGDFGHCTEKGNRLLAENIADAISKGRFNK